MLSNCQLLIKEMAENDLIFLKITLAAVSTVESKDRESKIRSNVAVIQQKQ